MLSDGTSRPCGFTPLMLCCLTEASESLDVSPSETAVSVVLVTMSPSRAEPCRFARYPDRGVQRPAITSLVHHPLYLPPTKARYGAIPGVIYQHMAPFLSAHACQPYLAYIQALAVGRVSALRYLRLEIGASG